MITRRGLLAGILGAGIAPAIVTNPMKIFVPKREIIFQTSSHWILDEGKGDETVVFRRRTLGPNLEYAEYGHTNNVAPPEIARLRNAQMRAMLDNMDLIASPPIGLTGVALVGIQRATAEVLRHAQPLKLGKFGKPRKWR